jgi:hypothetical protein
MCVIVYTEINGKKILAKNRDRTYKPDIEIVHEIVDGVEVAYIRDRESGWIEGMNENGLGLVNSTLSRTDGKVPKNRKVKIKQITKKNNVIYKALINPNKTNQNFYDIIKDAKNKYILEGHTLLFHNNEVFHIENNIENEFVAEKINRTAVFSNYGIKLKNEGYIKCKQGMSAFLRANIVKNELKNHKVKTIDELVNIMNRNYKNINPRFQPYRDKYYTMKKNKNVEPRNIKVSTTGQIVYNMTDKELIYYTDINNSQGVEYINKLSRDYAPKIRIIIKETEKKIKPVGKIFTKRFLKKVNQRFHCKTKKKIRNSFKERNPRKNKNKTHKV